MHRNLPPTRFLFVRHGQTVWNNEKRYAGSSEVALSPEADEQIAIVTEYLRNEKIDAIYCSPLTRCQQTIEPTAVIHDLRIIIRDELIERFLGEWEGKTADEIHAGREGYHFPEGAYNGEFRVPGAETLESVEKRLRAFMRDIHESHPGQTVAVATHAGVIWALHAHVVSNPPRKIRWATNCSVTEVHTEGGHYVEVQSANLAEMTKAISQPALS